MDITAVYAGVANNRSHLKPPSRPFRGSNAGQARQTACTQAAMFEPSLPYQSTGLMLLSDFQLRQDGLPHEVEVDAGATRLSSLNASLLQDLQRFDPAHRGGEGLEALEVLAAAVRHGRALLLHLQHRYRVIPLTVFPSEGAMHCALSLEQLLALELSELHVLHVEPARLRPPVSGDADPDNAARYGAELGPLLWELALRGAREDLLPEIAGPAVYRVAPGSMLQRLGLDGSLAAAVARLRRQACSLREIASWPGFDRERAMRLLNGLYLHAALMVSRSHPAAVQGERAADAP